MTTNEGRARRRALPSSLGWRFWLKIAFVGLVDALVVLAIPVLAAAESWILLALLVVAVLLINWTYLSPRARALKWLTAGLIPMAWFVVFPILYTAYVSLTNWATGNVLTQEQVVENLESQPIEFTGEAVPLEIGVYRNPAGELRVFARSPDGRVYFGTPRLRSDEPTESPLEDPAALGIDPAGEIPDQVGEFTKLRLIDFASNLDLNAGNYVLDIPEGVAQIVTPSQGRLVEAGRRYTYDAGANTLFDAQEDVTCVVEVGNFVCADGRRLDPGWRVVIGFDNFTSIVTNSAIRQPFLQVFVWNVVFALLSVVLTFVVGLAFANALQDERMRGKAFYRSMYIIPYAMPAFISVLVWRGLLNDQYGQVNRLLDTFAVPAVPWLLDDLWAKVAILLVNTWLGFPYMFLITSGALQAIPAEMKEAARVDGASASRVFRTITTPLLLVSTAPLLIGSFAFNFNNFNLIYLLTRGGPPVAGTDVPFGHTDILISFTYNLAVRSGRGQNFGLASAIVILIFILVAAFSAFSFRFTRRLEEVYGNV